MTDFKSQKVICKSIDSIVEKKNKKSIDSILFVDLQFFFWLAKKTKKRYLRISQIVKYLLCVCCCFVLRLSLSLC